MVKPNLSAFFQLSLWVLDDVEERAYSFHWIIVGSLINVTRILICECAKVMPWTELWGTGVLVNLSCRWWSYIKLRSNPAPILTFLIRIISSSSSKIIIHESMWYWFSMYQKNATNIWSWLTNMMIHTTKCYGWGIAINVYVDIRISSMKTVPNKAFQPPKTRRSAIAHR